MDSLSKKIGNLGLHDIRNAARYAQNMIVHYEPYQVDIRRATNTDSWGPTPKHLAKVMRHRYEVSTFLLTEYTLKRLVDHMAKRPKNMYEKARKQYINYGSEWRVVLKCLVLVEYLLLNVERGRELDQVLSCLQTHKHVLTRETMQYRVDFSTDGKMELHERGIKKKCENVIQLIDDSQYLKKERSKHAENAQKIVAGSISATPEIMFNDNAINADSIAVDSVYDEGDDFEYAPTTHRDRRMSAIEKQRKQRREVLRERIRTSEHERKSSLNEPQIDLLDLDGPEPTPQHSVNKHLTLQNTSAHSHILANNTNTYEDDEDDEFGEFQSEKNSVTKGQGNPPANATLNDLLDFGVGNSGTNTSSSVFNNAATTSSSAQKQDAFADLFSMSKNQT